MTMTGTVQFFKNLWKRVGDGGSPVKLKNWNITLEFRVESPIGRVGSGV